jgi:hypothetical protein
MGLPNGYGTKPCLAEGEVSYQASSRLVILAACTQSVG